MARPLRRHEPGTFHFLTARCYEARFFLRPDPAMNRVALEWLARAERAYPGVRLYAVLFMSNHVHLVLEDTNGTLRGWSTYLFGNLAKAVNRLRGRSGSVFGRRHSEEVVLDPDALKDRIVYTITNPAAAHLCMSHENWPGIALFAPKGEPHVVPVSWFDADHYAELCRTAGAQDQPRPPREDGFVHGQVTLYPLPQHQREPEHTAAVIEAIQEREAAIREERRREGKGVMTPEAVISQPWSNAPREPKRSPRPPCHTTDSRLRSSFIETFRAFVRAFRDAAAAWAARDYTAEFPAWCYPPGSNLVRAGPPLTAM